MPINAASLIAALLWGYLVEVYRGDGLFPDRRPYMSIAAFTSAGRSRPRSGEENHDTPMKTISDASKETHPTFMP